MKEATEHWRSIPGWEGLYEVSDHGRVRSLPRPTRTGRRGGRILTPGFDAEGRPQINLCRDGQNLPRRVHRLVAAAFLGPCPPGMVVCHGPAGGSDSSLANLRYDTQGSNIRDAIKAGTYRNGNMAKMRCPKCGGDFSFQRDGRRYCHPCRLVTIRARKARKKALALMSADGV